MDKRNGAMAKIRPRIAVTEPEHGARLSWWCIRLAVWLAGGTPLRITAASPRFSEAIDGLILAGGTDIDPRRYNGLPKQDYRYDLPRDQLELEWLARAERLNLPVLGICRGAQLINIHRGGDLHIDITKVYEKANYPNGTLARIFYRKRVAIHPDSLLRRLLTEDFSRINSMHTQAINRLGEGLKIAAEEKNRIIQAIEDPRRAMFMGVQFHPEYLIYARRYRNLFSWLVEVAGQSYQKPSSEPS
jgi:putative glutamine amidotransferase